MNAYSNLYLVTHQLVGGQNEGEIESLFDESTRGLELAGKRFNPSGSFDISKYYGKDIFSKHTFSHYEKINFDGFRPILDRISWIIKESGQDRSDT